MVEQRFKMKSILTFIGLSFLIIVSLWAINETTNTTDNAVNVTEKITPELREKYPIKPHHEKLSLDCIHCHEDQGDDPENFEFIGDKGCLSCHGSKDKIAKRTHYMDLFETNPHNSYHDGPTLSCDECHQEHQPSINMCMDCHEKEVPNWMKKVAP